MPFSSAASPLHRLLLLRWWSIAGQALLIALAVQGWEIALPWPAMLGVSLLLAALNLLGDWRLHKPWPVTELELFAHLAADTLALAALLYYSGGSSNPFVSLLLLPLTIAATLLARRYVWALAALTFAAYTLLLSWHLPLTAPHHGLPGLDALVCSVTGVDPAVLSHDNGFVFHVVGMWLNFFVSALIVTLFVSRLAAALRLRERELAQAREQTLRHEQILALGTLAAGTAHQLGTPLATMAVVLRDLQLDHAKDQALHEDISLLRQQVDQCKRILGQMLHNAEHARSEDAAPLAVDALLRRVLDEWQLLRPGVALRTELAVGPAPSVAADATLDQALLNLLDNAANASAEGLELHCQWDDAAVRIEIRDRGPGLSEETAARLGQAFFTTRAESGGSGLGLFLSNATLERLGGRVELFNRPGGGACTRVTLPCLS
ncbi:MAG TPA: HAMP domain-containing sensor histidine kinase [Rhodocyclaceae bacterium]